MPKIMRFLSEGRLRYLRCSYLKWLAIADEDRTRIIDLNKDIFIPELNY
ncbi:MAG: hypothetical protein H8E13_10500 [Actinobacteria bacterium]|nr:hypothetical protein [Actinomycetota bacterium]